MFNHNELLNSNKCKTIYWKTGHSHIKRKVNNENALAGFEKSGHFFFNKPLGYGYDDGINSAIQVCKLLDKNNKKMSEILSELPITYQSPTMAPYCKDNEKYQVVENLVKEITDIKKNKTKICYFNCDINLFDVFWKNNLIYLILSINNNILDETV